jgi:excisionase family DNA binding protein
MGERQTRTWTTQEAAEHYGVSRLRVRQWISEGRLRAVKRGRIWFVMKGQPRPEDLRGKGRGK